MDLFTTVLQYIVQGGPAAIMVLLLAAVVVLAIDRKKILKDLDGATQRAYDSKDHEAEMLRDIIDKYHKGNIDLIHALNEIKLVLVTMQSSRH